MARSEGYDKEYEVEAQRELRLLRYLVVATEIIVLVFILCVGLLTYKSWHTTLRPTSSPIAQTAPSSGPAPSSGSDDRWIPVHGEVILTLSLPKSEMVSSANASQKAHGLARTTLDAIPTASSVAVFDGMGSLIGRYRR